MNKPTPMEDNAAKRRTEQRVAFWLAVIIGGFITLSIGGMLLFDIYGEKQAGAFSSPHDAADR
jgi:hypothetical protein